MHSVLLDPPSPDQLHSNFSQAANGAAQAIKNFSQLVEDSRTKAVMENAKERRKQNGEGIIGWQVADHENWLDVKQEEGNHGVDTEERGTPEAGDGVSVSNVNAVLDKFRSSHVGVDISLDEESGTVTVSHLLGLIRIMLKSKSLTYLLQLRSIFKFSSMPPPKAKIVTVLTAKANQNFKERFLRQSEQGQKRI